jgi:hypothetical protein
MDITKWIQKGGSYTVWIHAAIASAGTLVKQITKKAGPSAGSANAKSNPQKSHRGRRVRNPLKIVPRPQRGQRPRMPVLYGDKVGHSNSSFIFCKHTGAGKVACYPVIRTVVVCPASEGPLQRTSSAPDAFQKGFHHRTLSR